MDVCAGAISKPGQEEIFEGFGLIFLIPIKGVFS